MVIDDTIVKNSRIMIFPCFTFILKFQTGIGGAAFNESNKA